MWPLHFLHFSAAFQIGWSSAIVAIKNSASAKKKLNRLCLCRLLKMCNLDRHQHILLNIQVATPYFDINHENMDMMILQSFKKELYIISCPLATNSGSHGLAYKETRLWADENVFMCRDSGYPVLCTQCPI